MSPSHYRRPLRPQGASPVSPEGGHVLTNMRVRLDGMNSPIAAYVSINNRFQLTSVWLSLDEIREVDRQVPILRGDSPRLILEEGATENVALPSGERLPRRLVDGEFLFQMVGFAFEGAE